MYKNSTKNPNAVLNVLLIFVLVCLSFVLKVGSKINFSGFLYFLRLAFRSPISKKNKIKSHGFTVLFERVIKN